jgi:chromosome segregation ATPase
VAATVGTLVVEITGDNTKLNKEIDQSQKGLKKFGGATKAALGIAATAITTATIAIGKAAVDAASRAEETQSKFNTVFSSIQDEAQATADNLRENFGLSSTAAQQLLGDTADLLTGFSFTQEEALKLSTQVNELAVDLASFTNFSGGAEGASIALTKALLGERESIKSLGIAITEADIKRLAEDKGIKGELDRQTKAALTLELAITQSKNAIGDFQRTQASFANQVRISKARTDELFVSLGQRLQPVAAGVLQVFNGLVKTASDLLSTDTELEKVTKRLASATDEYKEAVEELDEKAEDLTDTEKNLLEIRRDLAKAEALKAVIDLGKAYTNNVNTIEKLTGEIAAANNNQIRLNAAIDEAQATGKQFSRIQLDIANSTQKVNQSIEDNVQLGEILAEEAEKEQKAIKRRAELREVEAEAIKQIAVSLNEGIITQSALSILTEETQAKIIAQQKELIENQKEVNEEKETTIELTGKETETAEERAKRIEEANKAYAQAEENLKLKINEREQATLRSARLAEEARQKEAAGLKELAKQYEQYTLFVSSTLGDLISSGVQGFEAFKKAGLNAIASILEGLAKSWAIEAAAAFARPFGIGVPEGIGLTSASIAGTAAAGIIRGLREGGLVTQPILANIGEGGRNEAVIPLEDPDALARIGESIATAIPAPVTTTINNGAQFPERLTLNVDGQEFNAYLTDASSNGRFLIDSSRGLA